MNTPGRPVRYEIRVLGVLDDRWSAWFAGLDVASDAVGETTLTGPLPDQAALHGVLARIRDLGLPLIAVRRLDPDSGEAAEHPGNVATPMPRGGLGAKPPSALRGVRPKGGGDLRTNREPHGFPKYKGDLS
jgi:hypothetical protein